MVATGYAGDKRLNRCIEVNKHFYDGDGTGLFLLANNIVHPVGVRSWRPC